MFIVIWRDRIGVKVITGIVLTVLLMGTLMLAFNVQQTESSEPPATEWTRTYGGADIEGAFCVVETSDGGYALAGYTISFGAGGMDFWLVKVDSSGSQEWDKAYGGTNDEQAVCVVETSDGGYALAGYTESFGAGSENSWLVKVDSFGNMEWNQTYGGIDYSYEPHSMTQTEDGGYAIAGHTWSIGTGDSDFWLVKVDSFGNMEWTRTYGGADIEGAVSVVETSDGGYALTGQTQPFLESSADSWLVKVDSFGNMEWNQTYGGTNTERAFCVVETSDGGYALAGQTTSFGARSADFWLVKVAGRPTHGDELGLLALGIGLAAATLVVAVATTIYIFIKRARTLKNSTISL
jgi:hypothetical protein